MCKMNVHQEARGYVVASEYEEQPISRTYQYRKVMKPMLERKRRARINRCLDSLKELMVTALQAEGENVSKLEKADILELTVQHLHKLRRQHALGLTPEVAYADRFRAGFTHCAAEVSQYLATSMAAEPSIDPNSGVKLLQHLSSCIRRIDESRDSEASSPYTTPPCSPQHPSSPVMTSHSPAASSVVTSHSPAASPVVTSHSPAVSLVMTSHSPVVSPVMTSHHGKEDAVWRPW